MTRQNNCTVSDELMQLITEQRLDAMPELIRIIEPCRAQGRAGHQPGCGRLVVYGDLEKVSVPSSTARPARSPSVRDAATTHRAPGRNHTPLE